MSEQPILDFIKQLKNLQKHANMKSHDITRNGVTISDLDRYKSAAYADAYGYCILMLERIANHELIIANTTMNNR